LNTSLSAVGYQGLESLPLRQKTVQTPKIQVLPIEQGSPKNADGSDHADAEIVELGA
jgi:hypothetical protein